MKTMEVLAVLIIIGAITLVGNLVGANIPDDRCHPRHDLFNRYQHYWG